MKNAKRFLRDRFAAYLRDERGVSAAIVAVSLVGLIGISGFSIDMAHLLWVRQQLQNSVDAAALAGATDVVSAPGTALTLATSYSSLGGDKNAASGINATMVAGFPALKCFKTVTFPACPAQAADNGIEVEEQAIVPMWFLPIVGIKQITVSAAAVASAKGGNSTALDVMIVLDTTQSMGNPDSKCTGGTTRIACAKYGAVEIMNGLNPAIDKIGLLVFPGYTTSTEATAASTCTPPTSGIAKYAPYTSTPPYYTIAPLTNSFKASSSSKSLTATSAPVIAAGGSTSCPGGGIPALGGVQTDYSQALLEAQALLASDGDTTSQKVIIFLSDGDANSTSVTGGLSDVDECQQAIAAGRAAAAAGTWVYTVAYGSATSGSCSTDTTNYTGVSLKGVSACTTMQDIASDSTKFYSDDAAGCVGSAGNDSNVDALFAAISADLAAPRLLPLNTT